MNAKEQLLGMMEGPALIGAIVCLSAVVTALIFWLHFRDLEMLARKNVSLLPEAFEGTALESDLPAGGKWKRWKAYLEAAGFEYQGCIGDVALTFVKDDIRCTVVFQYEFATLQFSVQREKGMFDIVASSQLPPLLPIPGSTLVWVRRADIDESVRRLRALSRAGQPATEREHLAEGFKNYYELQRRFLQERVASGKNVLLWPRFLFFGKRVRVGSDGKPIYF